MMDKEFRSGYPSGLVVEAVQILMHHFWSPEPYRAHCPQYPVLIATLRAQSLIGDDGRITERGEVFVRALMDTPLPERKWVMP